MELFESNLKSEMRNKYGDCLSSEAIEHIIAAPEPPGLSNDRAFITALFSDVLAFSGHSEKLPPRELARLMNDYLNGMTDALVDQKGFIDKYVANSIQAMFGDPEENDSHALSACISALNMQEKQLELNKSFKSSDYPSICSCMSTTIGVSTGFASVGNFGSKQKYAYSMMGDTVNLAARLQSGAKAYGVMIMTTDYTKDEVLKYGDDIVFRYLDRIVIKGRSKFTDLYEVVSFSDDLTDKMVECLNLYNQGIEAYSAEDWNEAISHFQASEVLEVNQKGNEVGFSYSPSTVMIQRCKDMKENLQVSE